MKDRKFLIIGLIMILIGVALGIGSAIAAMVFRWNNPDMTEMRQFLENPGPTITCIIGYVIAVIGCAISKHSGR